MFVLQRRFSENREWDMNDSFTLRETIELEVECHNGDLSQGDANVNTYYPQTSTIQSQPIVHQQSLTQTQMQPPMMQQQQQQQPQQHQLQHQPSIHSKPSASSKLKNLPTLSISGPSPPFDEEEIL